VQPRVDTELSDELRAIAGKHQRFGYRRAHALLKRAGQQINHKRVARVAQRRVESPTSPATPTLQGRDSHAI
jgi:hypothetical protein